MISVVDRRESGVTFFGEVVFVTFAFLAKSVFEFFLTVTVAELNLLIVVSRDGLRVARSSFLEMLGVETRSFGGVTHRKELAKAL